MKHPGRPKSIGFRLASAEDAENVVSFVARTKERRLLGNDKEDILEKVSYNLCYTIYIHDEGQLGITFANAVDDNGLVVSNISSNIPEILAAVARGYLKVGYLLTSINDELVLGENGSGRNKALSIFQRIGSVRPMSLSFSKPYLHPIVLESNGNDSHGPLNELIFTQASSDNRKVYLSEFNYIPGTLESNGVLIGDQLVAINDMNISVAGDGANDYEDRLSRVSMMIHASSSYPLTFHFSRPSQAGAPHITLSVTVKHEEDIGCKFGCLEQYSDYIAVELFTDVKGPIQKLIRAKCSDASKLRVDAVDGQVAPSYVTPGMMASVLQRRWETNKKVEFILFDEFTFDQIQNIMKK